MKNLNIKEVRMALAELSYHDVWKDSEHQYRLVEEFINSVEELLAHNSIKQTPALFKPVDKGS